jgi:hypothetical protein
MPGVLPRHTAKPFSYLRLHVLTHPFRIRKN